MGYLLLISIGLSILVTWLLGGRLSRLADVHFEFWWTVPLIAIVQSLLVRSSFAGLQLPWWEVRPMGMMLSYIVLGIIVCMNRQLPGMWTVLGGVALNAIAIAANNGYMPITPEALTQIGYGDSLQHVPMGTVVLGSKDVLLAPGQGLLWWLGDLLVVGERIPRPTAMSVGDVLLAVGVFVFILQTTWSRATRQKKL
jgi:hypothetical protein